MQKYLIPTSVLFMAVSLGAYVVRGGIESVILFGLSSAVFSFLCFIERKRSEDLDSIKEELRVLRDQLANISVTLGWNRT